MIDLLIVALVLVLPLSIIQVLSHLSGWRRLAAAYAVPSSIRPHATLRFKSAQVGNTLLGGINNGLSIGIHEAGLRFSVFMIGFSYRPFFVPWEDITVSESDKRMVRLHFARVPDVPLRISARTYDRIMMLGRG
jgi:hypothetical protein